MSQPPERTLDGVMLRLTVPSGGALRIIAYDVAARLVEYLKDRAPSAGAIAAALDKVATSVAPTSPDAEITFDFRDTTRELLIVAHCGSRSSEVRCQLHA